KIATLSCGSRASLPATYPARGTLMRRRTLIVLLLVVLLIPGAFAGHLYVRGAAFVIRAAGIGGTPATAARWFETPVTTVDVPAIPWRGGELRARAYRPQHVAGTPILLVPGVHAAGIDEPRIVGFARDIAGTGHPVLTVELPDLKQYQITARSTDMIEDAASWMLRTPTFRAADGRIGMLGISFGGGLSVVAAGRTSIRDRVAFVMAFGGHGDLPRTLRYLCTGVQVDGAHRPPHDYSLAIVLLDAAPLVVPPAEVGPLREAILTYLEASRLDLVDKARSALEFAH